MHCMYRRSQKKKFCSGLRNMKSKKNMFSFKKIKIIKLQNFSFLFKKLYLHLYNLAKTFQNNDSRLNRIITHIYSTIDKFINVIDKSIIISYQSFFLLSL